MQSSASRVLRSIALLLIATVLAAALPSTALAQEPKNLLDTVCPACGKSLPNMATAHTCVPSLQTPCAEEVEFLKSKIRDGSYLHHSAAEIDELAQSGHCDIIRAIAKLQRDQGRKRTPEPPQPQPRQTVDTPESDSANSIAAIEAGAQAHESKAQQKAKTLELIFHTVADALRELPNLQSPRAVAQGVFRDPKRVWGPVNPLSVAYENFQKLFSKNALESLRQPVEYAGDGIQSVFDKALASAKESEKLIGSSSGSMEGGYPKRPELPAPSGPSTDWESGDPRGEHNTNGNQASSAVSSETTPAEDQSIGEDPSTSKPVGAPAGSKSPAAKMNDRLRKKLGAIPKQK
jgi:hypothetical protein